MATSLYCRNCSNHLPAASSFCPACGASQLLNDHTPTNYTTQEVINKGTGRLPAGRILRQRYRLLQTIGQGGMGAVYIAQDTQLGDRLVAVKEMSMSRLTQQELPRAVAQFQGEAHLLANLHHPNLPAIYDYFNEANRWYLVMSFVEGGTLQTSLDAIPDKKLPVNEVVRIGIELCNVLDYLHTHQPQVIFRDLKPSNIMVTPKGHVFLIDFGIARHFKQEQTQDTMYYYSLGYAPPEQYGQSQTSPRSDIYSLGATLHQMLSGHSPSSRPFQFPALHLVDPTIPLPLANLIAQMLEMNEQARPASAMEVKEQLEQVLTPKVIELPTRTVEIEPTVMAGVEYKEEEQAKQEKQEQNSSSQADSVQNLQGGWSNIDAFFVRRRTAAWVCFIIVSLFSFFMYNNLFTAIPTIAVIIIGLIFLLKKEAPYINSIGGATLVLCGSGVIYTAYNLYIIYRYSELYRDYNGNHAILLINALWLVVGTRFFLRNANTEGGLVFGLFLILIGIASSLFHIGTNFSLDFMLTILGVVAVIVTLHRRRQSKHIR